MHQTSCTFVTIFADRLSRTQAFYRAIGVPLKPEKHGDGPLHHSFNSSEVAVEIFAREDSSLSDLGTLFGFEVASLSDACTRLKAIGADCVRDAACLGGVRRAVFLDPDRRAVFIFERGLIDGSALI